MSFQLRLTSILAGTAFVIAFLAGIIAGVPFGYILLRSLVGTVVFAVLGLLLSFIVQQFLPELLEEQNDTDPSVDISVGEEDDDMLRRSMRGSDEVPSDSEGKKRQNDTDSDFDESLDSNKTRDDDGEDSSPRFRPGIEADLVEEVQEYRAEADDAGQRASAREDHGSGLSADSGADVLDVDELPDMGSMSDAFISTESGGEGDEFSGSGGEADGEQAIEMAKAIRTVLQREQQG